MARPIEEGLEYFPLDVDFFDDPKILLIEEEFGIKGGYVAARLLCWIYRQGYYLKWDDEMALVFAKRVGNGMTCALVNELVNAFLSRSLFDKGLFQRCAILTSRGIQERWIKIITDAKRKAKINPEFNLINSEETRINTEETTGDPLLMQQRKGKESKGEREAPAEISSGENPLANSNLFRKPHVPDFETVHRVFIQQGGTKEMADKFFSDFESTSWYYKGSPLTNFSSRIPGFIAAWRQNENKNGKTNSNVDVSSDEYISKRQKEEAESRRKYYQ